MKAGDVMTKKVVSIRPDASVADMAKLMLDNGISGLPVIDDHGDLVGIVTEGDCLRRAETGTERKRPRLAGVRGRTRVTLPMNISTPTAAR